VLAAHNLGRKVHILLSGGGWQPRCQDERRLTSTPTGKQPLMTTPAAAHSDSLWKNLAMVTTSLMDHHLTTQLHIHTLAQQQS